MFNLILLAVLLTVSLGNSESLENNIEGRMVGGEEISDNERYVVPIKLQIWCNCVILNGHWLLGTSQCFIYHGLNNGDRPTFPETGTVTLFFYDDLALLQLSEPMLLIQVGYYRAIALPNLGEYQTLPNNTQVTIVNGFSKMSKELTIGDECRKFYQSSLATEDYICMEVTEEETTCSNDDDGAIMVVNGKLVALATIARVTSTCPSSATYQLFVKILGYREWIYRMTNL